MKNALLVLCVLCFALLSVACFPGQEQVQAPSIKPEENFLVGVASGDAIITRSKDRVLACAFSLEVPDYGLIRFEATSENPGVFIEDSREACSLVRKGDRVQVLVTTYYSGGLKMTPDRWAFEAKAIYGRMVS